MCILCVYTYLYSFFCFHSKIPQCVCTFVLTLSFECIAIKLSFSSFYWKFISRLLITYTLPTQRLTFGSHQGEAYWYSWNLYVFAQGKFISGSCHSLTRAGKGSGWDPHCLCVTRVRSKWMVPAAFRASESSPESSAYVSEKIEEKHAKCTYFQRSEPWKSCTPCTPGLA